MRLDLRSVLVVGLSLLPPMATVRPAAAAHPDAIVAAGAVQPVPARQPAPDFHLEDANGDTISLAANRGKVVLLDFWATWCGGCKLEIPWYMDFDQKYKSSGLSVIGVAMDEEGWAKVRPFLAQKKDAETGGNTAMQYPVVLGSAALAQQYHLTSMPMTLLIDRQGKIAYAHTGVVDKAEFEQALRRLLEQH